MTVKISLPPSATWAGSVGRQTIGSLGSSEDSTTGSLKKPNFNERHPKVVRSLTVAGYIFCVSLAAIILSAYYVVLWTPKLSTESKNINVNTTNLPCRGGPEESTEYYATQYYNRPSRYSSRHGRPRSSRLIHRGGPRTKSPRKIIDSDGSLQRDSPFAKEGNHTISNNNSEKAPPPFDETQQIEMNDYSLEDEEEEQAAGMEKTATSFVPNSSSDQSASPSTTTHTPPDSIILRNLLEGRPTTSTTEEPR